MGNRHSLDSNENHFDGTQREGMEKQNSAFLRLRGGAVPHHTKVRLLRDPKYFYIGFECDEPNTAEMIAAQRVNSTTRKPGAPLDRNLPGRLEKGNKILPNHHQLACRCRRWLSACQAARATGLGIAAAANSRSQSRLANGSGHTFEKPRPLNPEGFSANSPAQEHFHCRGQYINRPYATGFRCGEFYQNSLQGRKTATC